MKKLYIMPAITVVSLQIGNVLTQASQLQVGETVNNISADSRQGADFDWDDEE